MHGDYNYSPDEPKPEPRPLRFDRRSLVWPISLVFIVAMVVGNSSNNPPENQTRSPSVISNTCTPSGQVTTH